MKKSRKSHESNLFSSSCMFFSCEGPCQDLDVTAESFIFKFGGLVAITAFIITRIIILDKHALLCLSFVIFFFELSENHAHQLRICAWRAFRIGNARANEIRFIRFYFDARRPLLFYVDVPWFLMWCEFMYIEWGMIVFINQIWEKKHLTVFQNVIEKLLPILFLTHWKHVIMIYDADAHVR